MCVSFVQTAYRQGERAVGGSPDLVAREQRDVHVARRILHALCGRRPAHLLESLHKSATNSLLVGRSGGLTTAEQPNGQRVEGGRRSPAARPRRRQGVFQQCPVDLRDLTATV